MLSLHSSSGVFHTHGTIQREELALLSDGKREKGGWSSQHAPPKAPAYGKDPGPAQRKLAGHLSPWEGLPPPGSPGAMTGCPSSGLGLLEAADVGPLGISSVKWEVEEVGPNDACTPTFPREV